MHCACMTTVSVPTYSHCRPLAGHESAKIFSAMDSPDPSWKVYLHSKMYLYFRDTLCFDYYLLFESIRGVLAHSAAVADGPVLGGLDQPEAGCAVLPLVDRGAGVGGGEGRVRGEDPREEGAEGGAGARHHLQGVAAAHCNTGEDV